jgi:hypothetical protein
MSGPCTAWASLDATQSLPAARDIDPDLLATELIVASELLYALSGRQFAGLCSDTVRPARRDLLTNVPTWWNFAGLWRTFPTDDFYAHRENSISLGAFPIRDVTQVLIDGVALDPTLDYRLDERRWLVKLDGGSWPMWQDLYLPATEANTFEVSFLWGQDPPVAGVEACKELAVEMTLARMDRPESNVPQRVLSLVSQGATYTLLDPMTFLKEGGTGIYRVDAWLHSMNPDGLKRRSRVFNVDRMRPVRRVGGISGS